MRVRGWSLARRRALEQVHFLEQAIKASYRRLARKRGLDPDRLDGSTWRAMHQSLTDGLRDQGRGSDNE